MIISSKLENKTYKNGVELSGSNCSHYNYLENDIVIYLPEVLKHSLDCNITQAFTQHITHEIVHKLLMNIEGLNTTEAWDNLGGKEVFRIEGYFTLKDWYGGMYDKDKEVN